MTVGPPARIRRAVPDFEPWDELLGLIREAFAAMEGRIAPASSVHRLTAAQMAADAAAGLALLAEQDGGLVGCLFCQARGDAFYLSKLAIRPDRRRNGIGRALVEAAAAEARARGLAVLELQTRIELVENHAAFAALGFARVGETAHPGFDRPTSITLRRAL